MRFVHLLLRDHRGSLSGRVLLPPSVALLPPEPRDRGGEHLSVPDLPAVHAAQCVVSAFSHSQRSIR